VSQGDETKEGLRSRECVREKKKPWRARNTWAGRVYRACQGRFEAKGNKVSVIREKRGEVNSQFFTPGIRAKISPRARKGQPCGGDSSKEKARLTLALQKKRKSSAAQRLNQRKAKKADFRNTITGGREGVISTMKVAKKKSRPSKRERKWRSSLQKKQKERKRKGQ